MMMILANNHNISSSPITTRKQTMRSSPALLKWFLAYPLLRASSSSHSNCRFLASAWQTQTQLQSFFRQYTRCSSCCRHATNTRHQGIAGVYPRACASAASKSTALLFTTISNGNPDILTSTSSSTVKRFKELQQKAKKRREARETVIEGPRMVLDLLRHPSTRRLIQHIIVSTELGKDLQIELEEACLEAGKDNDNGTNNYNHIQVQTAMPHVLKACSDTVTPQGIVARVKLPEWNEQEIAMSKTAAAASRAPLYLVLDGVSDPGNMGTLLRSSVAVGVSAVLLLPGSCDVWNPKAVRSAMSASFLVPTFAVDSWNTALEQLQNWNCSSLWAATMLEGDKEGMSSAHYDVPWGSGVNALIIGSEGKGLSENIRQCLVGSSTTSSSGLVQAVHVPMQEGAIESLNAGVCGSIILFEYMRQCRQQ